MSIGGLDRSETLKQIGELQNSRNCIDKLCKQKCCVRTLTYYAKIF